MKGINMGRTNGKTYDLLRNMFMESGLNPRYIDSAIAWRNKYLDKSKTPPQFNRQHPVLADMDINERYLYIFPNGYAISIVWRTKYNNYSPEVALLFWDEENYSFELSNLMMDLYDWNDSVRRVNTRRELINVLNQASSIKSNIKFTDGYIKSLREYVKYRSITPDSKYWFHEYLKDKGLDIYGEPLSRAKSGAVKFVAPPDDLINDFSPEFKRFNQNMETINMLNKDVSKRQERILKEMEQHPLSGLESVIQKVSDAFSGLASSVRDIYNK